MPTLELNVRNSTSSLHESEEDTDILEEHPSRGTPLPWSRGECTEEGRCNTSGTSNEAAIDSSTVPKRRRKRLNRTTTRKHRSATTDTSINDPAGYQCRGDDLHRSRETGDNDSPWSGWKNSRYFPVLLVKNTASTARDHLASERTFLAYFRTSLGLAVMGVALVQLFNIAEITDPNFNIRGASNASNTHKLQRFGRPLGAVTVALSLVVLVQGVWRYFKIQFSLFDNNFPIARMSIVTQIIIFTGIIVAVFATIVAGD